MPVDGRKAGRTEDRKEPSRVPGQPLILIAAKLPIHKHRTKMMELHFICVVE